MKDIAESEPSPITIPVVMMGREASSSTALLKRQDYRLCKEQPKTKYTPNI